MAHRSKATDAQMEERITKVTELLLAGAGPTDIFRYVSEHTDWGVGKRQVENYIAAANAEIARAASINREAEFAKAAARLNQLYAKALKIQDYKTCLAIQKELNSLYGLR